jgi:hypothetical protein
MTPLGLLLSLIGVVVDKNKKPAVMGLVLCGIIAALFSLLVLC